MIPVVLTASVELLEGDSIAPEALSRAREAAARELLRYAPEGRQLVRSVAWHDEAEFSVAVAAPQTPLSPPAE